VGCDNPLCRADEPGEPSAIRELLRLGADPDIISFGGGYPDPALFPIAELRAKVAYVPGATFFPVKQEPNHARLSFSGVPDDRIVRGITELGRLLRR
jgi:DNA-binding transcriptional MocR family regulator